MTTANHRQANRRAKRLNRTIVTRLRHYVAEHQRDQALYVQRLSYAYNTQAHRHTNTSPYTMVLSRHPPEPRLMHTTLSAVSNLITSNLQQMRRQTKARLATSRTRVNTHQWKSQARYKSGYDR